MNMYTEKNWGTVNRVAVQEGLLPQPLRNTSISLCALHACVCVFVTEPVFKAAKYSKHNSSLAQRCPVKVINLRTHRGMMIMPLSEWQQQRGESGEDAS